MIRRHNTRAAPGIARCGRAQCVRPVRRHLDAPVRRNWVSAYGQLAGFDPFVDRRRLFSRPGSAPCGSTTSTGCGARGRSGARSRDVLRADLLVAVATFSRSVPVQAPGCQPALPDHPLRRSRSSSPWPRGSPSGSPSGACGTAATTGASCSSSGTGRRCRGEFADRVGAPPGVGPPRHRPSRSARRVEDGRRRVDGRTAVRIGETVDDIEESSTAGSSTKSRSASVRARRSDRADHSPVRGGGPDRPDPARRPGLTLPGGRVEDFDGMPVLSLVYGPDRAARARRQAPPRRRRSALGPVVLAPVLVVVALLYSRRRRRAGPLPPGAGRARHGRPFQVAKFRTMAARRRGRARRAASANEIQRPRVQARPNDPRVTRTGRFLRRDQPRRAAAALERPPRRDEPRRAATAAAARGRRATTSGIAVACR